jgi:hypothetical protein
MGLANDASRSIHMAARLKRTLCRSNRRLSSRVGPEQTNFRRHAAATGPTVWDAKASSTSFSENQAHELEQQISSRLLFRR